MCGYDGGPTGLAARKHCVTAFYAMRNTKLDLHVGKRDIGALDLNQLFYNAGSLKSLDLDLIADVYVPFPTNLKEFCPNLKNLSLNYLAFDGREEKATIERFENIKKLGIYRFHKGNIEAETLENILKTSPDLEELTLDRCMIRENVIGNISKFTKLKAFYFHRVATSDGFFLRILRLTTKWSIKKSLLLNVRSQVTLMIGLLKTYDELPECDTSGFEG